MPPYINIHTHRPEPETLSVQNVRLSATATPPAQGFFSAGIHPWDAAQAQPEWLQLVANDSPRLLAVGETGLDLRPAFAPHRMQEEWFERQIEWANRLRKPLIVHNVHATEALQRLLGGRTAVPTILHGFTGAPETGRQWIRRGPEVRFSFGPTTEKSPKTQEAARWVARESPERLFLETDDDPQSPIRTMYARCGAWTGWDIAELKELILSNFNALIKQ